jgi:hypothetical protein
MYNTFGSESEQAREAFDQFYGLKESDKILMNLDSKLFEHHKLIAENTYKQLDIVETNHGILTNYKIPLKFAYWRGSTVNPFSVPFIIDINLKPPYMPLNRAISHTKVITQCVFNVYSAKVYDDPFAPNDYERDLYMYDVPKVGNTTMVDLAYKEVEKACSSLPDDGSGLKIYYKNIMDNINEFRSIFSLVSTPRDAKPDLHDYHIHGGGTYGDGTYGDGTYGDGTYGLMILLIFAMLIIVVVIAIITLTKQTKASPSSSTTNESDQSR